MVPYEPKGFGRPTTTSGAQNSGVPRQSRETDTMKRITKNYVASRTAARVQRRVNPYGVREHRISISPERRAAFASRQAGQGAFNLFGDKPTSTAADVRQDYMRGAAVARDVAQDAYYVTEQRQLSPTHQYIRRTVQKTNSGPGTTIPRIQPTASKTSLGTNISAAVPATNSNRIGYTSKMRGGTRLSRASMDGFGLNMANN